MASWNPLANELFLEARELAGDQQRIAFLNTACGGDEQLKAHVWAMLAAGERAGDFLSSPAPELYQSARDWQSAERSGDVIGPYKLLEQIGEGGMGVVYMAEQTHPVKRRVALKIIKPGMDTRQVIARFEAERQALALMDHPNIAKVLDAGTTSEGSRGTRGEGRVPEMTNRLFSPLAPRLSPLRPAGPSSSWNSSKARPSPRIATSAG
jgi:serine/threonine protein kinase